MDHSVLDGFGTKVVAALCFSVFLLAMTVLPTPTRASAAPEAWLPVSNTAISITGRIRLTRGRIRFENGKSLALASAGSVTLTGLNGEKLRAELFRVENPADPVLLNANRLCGGSAPVPVKYIAIWRYPPISGDQDLRGLAAFSGPARPGAIAQSCATYSYEAAH